MGRSLTRGSEAFVYNTPTFLRRLSLVCGTTVVAAAAGGIVATPALGFARLLLLLGAGVTVALILPLEVFLAVSLVFIGAMQLAEEFTISAGPATLYGPDLFIGLVLLRALLGGSSRMVPAYRFSALTYALMSLVGFLALLGVIRATLAGVPTVSALRSAQGFGYWIFLYIGYSRLFRRSDLRLERVLVLCVWAGLALVGYMLAMRALGRPFESEGKTALGQVVVSGGNVLHRDFGFASAFIFYPTLALLGMAILMYSRRRRTIWLLVSIIGIAATLSTLIRSEILGLAGGTLALVVVSRSTVTDRLSRGYQRARIRMTLSVVSAFAAFALVIATLDQAYAHAVAERAVPTFGQSSEAVATAEVRREALRAGVEFANYHAAGIGLLPPDALAERGINPEWLGHSMPAAILFYLGWPGLFAIGALLLALARESAVAPSAAPWIHPFTVATLVMMTLYGFGAIGMFGQPFVIALGAFVVAVRFSTLSQNRR